MEKAAAGVRAQHPYSHYSPERVKGLKELAGHLGIAWDDLPAEMPRILAAFAEWQAADAANAERVRRIVEEREQGAREGKWAT